MLVDIMGAFMDRPGGRCVRRFRLFFALTTFLVMSCGGRSSDVLRVGVLLPYSADSADFFRSMQMAIDEVNDAGGAHGKRLELVLYDVMWDAQISYESFYKAAEDGEIAMIGGLASFLARREAEAALELRIPHVGCCATSDTLTTIQPPGADRFFFRVAPADRLQSVVIAERAYNRSDLLCRKLGIVHTDDTYGNPLAASLATAFTALGGDVVAQASQPFFTSDFEASVQTIAAGNPDCIVLVANVDDGRGFRKAWTDGAHATVKWMGSDSMVGEALSETYRDPHLSDGIYVFLPWSLGTPTADAFLARYEARYGRAPLPASVASYDAAAIIALAIVSASSTDGDAIRDALFDVTNVGGEVIEVGDLAHAVALIEAGQDVDYVGFSGTLELDPCGDTIGDYAMLELDADVVGGYTTLEVGLNAEGVPSPCPE
jgi:branched-chain amino acid transport system substrate-binding protein